MSDSHRRVDDPGPHHDVVQACQGPIKNAMQNDRRHNHSDKRRPAQACSRKQSATAERCCTRCFQWVLPGDARLDETSLVTQSQRMRGLVPGSNLDPFTCCSILCLHTSSTFSTFHTLVVRKVPVPANSFRLSVGCRFSGEAALTADWERPFGISGSR